MWLIVLTLLALLIAVISLYLGYRLTLAVTFLHNPVFIPSADDKLSTMLALPRVTKSSRVIDFGSGDGKVTLAFAQRFQQPVTGVEINPFLVRTSRSQAKELDLDHLVTIYRKSFWQVDLGQFDLLFLYGSGYIMEKMEQKILTEMKPGSQIVSNAFTFPNLKPKKTHQQVYLYQI